MVNIGHKEVQKSPNKKMGVKIIWTEQMLQELGTITDKEFSIKYGMSEKTITRFRRDNNLVTQYARYIPGRSLTWSDEMLADLKLLHDTEIAAKYHISIGAIRAKRKLDCITGIKKPSGYKAIDQYEWPSNKAQLFECLNNEEIANLLDIPSNIVGGHRIQLAIPIPVKSLASMFNMEARALKKSAQLAKIKNNERAADIIKCIREGENPKDLATFWGISIDRVYRIFENREVIAEDMHPETYPVDDMMDKPVEALGLNPKINSILLMNGTSTIRELTALTKPELLKMVNLGRRYAVEIMLSLEKHNLSLS